LNRFRALFRGGALIATGPSVAGVGEQDEQAAVEEELLASGLHLGEYICCSRQEQARSLVSLVAIKECVGAPARF
jgi:hypothetical protein